MLEAGDGGGSGMFSVSPEHLDQFARSLQEMATAIDAQIGRLRAVHGTTSFGRFGEASGLEQAFDTVLNQLVTLSTRVHQAMSSAGTATTAAKVTYQLADMHSGHATRHTHAELSSVTPVPAVHAS